MGAIQGIEPCTIHRLLGYQPRKGDADLDAAGEEARLGTQGAFTYNRCTPWRWNIGGMMNGGWLVGGISLAAAIYSRQCPRLPSLNPTTDSPAGLPPMHPHPHITSRSNPLPADAVLVDEASMLSLPLAAALVDALRPRCQLVLVGDVDQLPPVGERQGAVRGVSSVGLGLVLVGDVTLCRCR